MKPTAPARVDTFADTEWQMSFGERAALKGLLAELAPELAVEIGTADGGSLRRIAAYSREVHAIDVTDEFLTSRPPNATFHKGSSAELLPELLAGLEAESRNVDFALVDGDHSVEGVRADLANLLASPAVSNTVILLHDSFNPWVRIGIERAAPRASDKVTYLDLDFTPGRMVGGGPFDGQLWGGFAIVLVGDHGTSAKPAGQRDLDVRTADSWETAVRAAPLLAHLRGESRALAREALRRWLRP